MNMMIIKKVLINKTKYQELKNMETELIKFINL